MRLRPIHADDEPRLGDLYDRLSRQTAYQRFFTVMRRLPPDWAHFLANVDYARRFALVAEDARAATPTLVGVARYEPVPNDDAAELAFVVQDSWQGKGLGPEAIKTLARHLIDELGHHRLTIDPDATRVAVYGAGKQGSAFSRTGQTALSPLVGAVGETGDVLALRARGGAANDGRAMGSFIDECVGAIPVGARGRYRLWIRVDSAGYQQQVVEAAERHGADFTVTAKGYPNVVSAVHTLAADPETKWVKALGHESNKGSEIAEATVTLLGRQLRLIVRRQPKAAGDQLAFDDLDCWRLHAIITNIDATRMSAAEIEAHHRLRGGIPEDTIRSLKNDFGMIHAPVQPFFGNWLYWQAAALAQGGGGRDGGADPSENTIRLPLEAARPARR